MKLEIVLLMLQGMKDRQIADKVKCTIGNIRYYRKQLAAAQERLAV